jgi:hypothetical protein
MNKLSFDVLLAVIEFLPDLTNLSLVSKKHNDVVNFARERNLTKSKREHFLKVDKMLQRNKQFVFLHKNEFIWRYCKYQDDLGIYYGSTQQILDNKKLSNESTLTIASVLGTTLMLIQNEYKNYDSDIDVIFNVIHLLDCAKKKSFYDKDLKILHWGTKRVDLNNLTNIRFLNDNDDVQDEAQTSASCDNFFPNSLRCIKECYDQKPFNNGLFIATISEFLGLFVCDQNDNKIMIFPSGSKFFRKLMDKYALIIIPKIDEISALCLIDVDSTTSLDNLIHLIDYPSKIKPDVAIINSSVFIRCESWYLLTFLETGHRIHRFDSHHNDYPVFCPVNGIEWIPSHWYLMEQNDSMKLSEFEKLDGCSVS